MMVSVSDLLLANKKSGPGGPPHLARYCIKECTGHTTKEVLPEYVYLN